MEEMLLEKKGMRNQRSLPKKWSPDDLKGITKRTELAKEQSGCSLSSVMEIVEILEFLQGIAPDFPESQQRYFRETADELITLAISHLEKLRTDFGMEERWSIMGSNWPR